ncbi:MAG TPA: MgtC/SapB family protein [Armatimonadota bacterium]|nr:MgtC/SapB family protein [Armatimonadota bacterium]
MQEMLSMGFKLLLAGILGGFVGYEREVHEHPAGLRTHILVCLGSALITLVSLSFSSTRSDPGRIAAQIVSGIGFLGAGTILRQGSIVRGLTTAASLWTVAGIGMAVAIGGVYYWVAVIATAIVFITLSIMRSLEPSMVKRTGGSLYVEVSERQLQTLATLINKLADMGVSIQSVKSLEAPAEGKRAFKLEVAIPRGAKLEAVTQLLVGEAGVDRFEWA